MANVTILDSKMPDADLQSAVDDLSQFGEKFHVVSLFFVPAVYQVKNPRHHQIEPC